MLNAPFIRVNVDMRAQISNVVRHTDVRLGCHLLFRDSYDEKHRNASGRFRTGNVAEHTMVALYVVL